jgi:hypothetical protein
MAKRGLASLADDDKRRASKGSHCTPLSWCKAPPSVWRSMADEEHGAAELTLRKNFSGSSTLALSVPIWGAATIRVSRMRASLLNVDYSILVTGAGEEDGAAPHSMPCSWV